MLRPGKPKGARQGTVLPETFDLQFDQHDIFEIDRSNLVLQLRIISRSMKESAEELEMVAIERVFVDSVSRALIRTARILYRDSEDLSGLLQMVERTHLPKEPERSNLKPRQRSRRKGQN